jgi:hypothetical protein
MGSEDRLLEEGQRRDGSSGYPRRVPRSSTPSRHEALAILARPLVAGIAAVPGVDAAYLLVADHDTRRMVVECAESPGDAVMPEGLSVPFSAGGPTGLGPSFAGALLIEVPAGANAFVGAVGCRERPNGQASAAMTDLAGLVRDALGEAHTEGPRSIDLDADEKALRHRLNNAAALILGWSDSVRLHGASLDDAERTAAIAGISQAARAMFDDVRQLLATTAPPTRTASQVR